MLAAWWNAVSQHTISNCFQKAGFFETQENFNGDDWERKSRYLGRCPRYSQSNIYI
jgi:hypothetical protein